MAIDPIFASKAYLNTAKSVQDALKDAGPGDAIDFGQLVKNAVGDAQGQLQAAETQSFNVAAGKADIVDVVTAIAAAESTLETVVAVRDQVIQAYQEIMRMPI